MVRLRPACRVMAFRKSTKFTIHYGEIKTIDAIPIIIQALNLQSTMVRLRRNRILIISKWMKNLQSTMVRLRLVHKNEEMLALPDLQSTMVRLRLLRRNAVYRKIVIYNPLW